MTDHTMTEEEYARLYKIYHDEEYYMVCEFVRFVAWYTAKERQKLVREKLEEENRKPKFFGGQ